MTPEITRIDSLSQGDLAPLLEASEAEGYGFVRRVVREWISGTNTFSGPGEALLGASVDGRLVGIGGLMADPYARDPSVGRLRNVYVLPTFRDRGVGRRLVERIVALARVRFAVLRLRAETSDAARLYERMGFVRLPDGGDATHAMRLPPADAGVCRG
jgi:GNAT superfamily N-acetyltransferase